ncbi:DUF4299 family protein [Clostridium botulinum]|nr:DUF4299 family protein [Clostridium botulinum]
MIYQNQQKYIFLKQIVMNLKIAKKFILYKSLIQISICSIIQNFKGSIHMGLTVKINRKSLFGNKKVDVKYMLKVCHLKYGSRNEFAVLDEDKINNDTFVAYNPNAIGRGIFFDCREINSGKIEIGISFPTTEKEIDDFMNVIKEINSQLKKIEILCIEENKRYKFGELINEKDRIVEFSLKTLKEGCLKNMNMPLTYTLAMWPVTLTNEQRNEFSKSNDLKQFEILLNEKQKIDAYYAKPRIYRNSVNNTTVAVYTLTEDCDSIFPVDGNNFMNLEKIEIDEILIQFYFFSEKRVADGIYNYNKFIDKIMKDSIDYFDERHILIKPLTKNDINKIIELIKN